VPRGKIVPVPGAAPELLGLAGIRGGVVPVFSLASILGEPSSSDQDRWMLLCGTPEPIAIAFSQFDGHLRLPASSLHPDASAESTRRFVSQVASGAGDVRSIISIPIVLAAIRSRAARNPPSREQ